jgi:TfoX/Sxy family transcriptional regulator of competence genes
LLSRPDEVIQIALRAGAALKMPYDEKIAERVRALLANRSGVEEKSLMGHLAFMVEGSMCCSVGTNSVLFRVPAAERDALLASPHVTPMKMGARTMQGFVHVAPAGYRTAAALTKWLERGIAAAGARPKARSKAGRRRA